MSSHNMCLKFWKMISSLNGIVSVYYRCFFLLVFNIRFFF